MKTLEEQLAAEREARKSAEARIEADFEAFHDTRVKVSEACGDPYLLHDDAVDLIIARMKSAEQRNRETMEQEPEAWIVLVSGEYSHIRDTNPALHDDAQEDGESEISYVPLYAAPIPPADVSELHRECKWEFDAEHQRRVEVERENAELRAWKESAIAVMPDYQAIGKAIGAPLGESVHDKILPAITELTRKLAEQQSQNNFDATRLRRLTTFCGVAAPDSDEELLQVAGVVIGSCLRVLESRRTDVPDVEWLASVIRKVDGRHSLGASDLAEQIAAAIRAKGN